MTTFNRNVMAIFVAKYITKNEKVFLYAFTRETLRLNQFPTEPLYRSTLFLLFPCKLCVPSEILTHLLIGSKHMIFNANLRNSTKQYKIITNNRLCNGVLPAGLFLHMMTHIRICVAFGLMLFGLMSPSA